MKKLLALLLIFLLCLAMVSCGGDEPADDQGGAGNEDEIMQDNQDAGENPGYLDIEDLYVGEDLDATFDFAFVADKEYPMEETVEALDTKDISVHGDALSKLLAAKAKDVFGVKFTGYGDYMEDYDEGIPALTEAVAIEEGDSNQRYLAAGIYETDEGEFWQYTRYAGKSQYKISSREIENAVADVAAGYGVQVSADKVEAAYEEVLANTEQYGGYYTVNQTKEFDRGDYTEIISVFVEGFQEDEVCCYLCVERSICYN